VRGKPLTRVRFLPSAPNLTFRKLTDFFVGGAKRRPSVLPRQILSARAGKNSFPPTLSFCPPERTESFVPREARPPVGFQKSLIK